MDRMMDSPDEVEGSWMAIRREGRQESHHGPAVAFQIFRGPGEN
jgi:hypothetical protein